MSEATSLRPVGKALWAVAPSVLRVTGRLIHSLRINYEGALPGGALVVAANHFSAFDPPLVGVALDRVVRFLAVDELSGKSKLLDRGLDWFGTISLPRRTVPLGALTEALDMLTAGQAVGVFPEGARVEKWGDRAPKRGAAWLALKAGVPLVPVAIKGSDRAFDIDNRWHRSALSVTVGVPLDGKNPEELTSNWETWIDGKLESPSG